MRTRMTMVLALCAIAVAPALRPAAATAATCTLSPIACENLLPGTPASQWDTSNDDGTTAGFTTDISVNRGATVHFKISTPARSYRIDVYRLGYYQGLGARRVATVGPSANLPQTQPSCLTDAATGLIDCGNWAESASWQVPATAVSGVYVAHVVRTDATGDAHVVFVVRDDSSHSQLLFQTSDTTWQAYNDWGGNSLYVGAPADRAYKVSYNRPFRTRDSVPNGRDFVFANEYPAIRWLEANGYDVSYQSGLDTDRAGALLPNHRVFLSVGHDEYWSGGQRANVEAARDAGVNLAFLSGNESFWKTRWEPSISDGTANRTLVSYKETKANAKIDPSPQWTGTWRDTRFSPPADGGRPENAMSGTLWRVQAFEGSLVVPAQDGAMRFWRNTGLDTQTQGQAATIGTRTLGYEFDEAPDDLSAPPGLVPLSTTTVDVQERLVDEGSTVAPGTTTHHLALHRAPSGALVFSAGTIQWAWGLDGVHDGDQPPPSDIRIRQATMNLFMDMGVAPSTPQSDLVVSAGSTDRSAPTATITAPASGATVVGTATTTITGTATDTGGGRVGAVEVSTDGGTTWRRAQGRGSWQFSWSPAGGGATTVLARATDDSGNTQSTPASRPVTVTCPCKAFDDVAPLQPASTDAEAVSLGVRFRTDVDGMVTGVRFYKGPGNGGVHTGSLWTDSGQLLAKATFTGESASGWQQVNFSTPVFVTAGTSYVASYYAPQGHYATTIDCFLRAGRDSPPLHLLRDGDVGGNGLYQYDSDTFPGATYRSEDYGVDVVFNPGGTPPPPPPPSCPCTLWPSSVQPGTPASSDPASVELGVRFRADTSGTVLGVRFYKGAGNTGVHVGSLWTTSGTRLASVTFTGETATGWQEARFATPVPLQAETTYIASYLAPNGHYAQTGNGFGVGVDRSPLHAPASAPGAGNGVYLYGTGGFPNQTWAASNYWVDVLFSPGTVPPPPPPTCPCSVFTANTIPSLPAASDTASVELGMRFTADVAGKVSAIRFYKGPGNTGTHTGTLWTASGQQLATVTFTGETSSGWQTAVLATPVSIAGGTSYIVSYHAPVGRYSADLDAFASAPVDAAPLHAPRSTSTAGNGLFVYGPRAFPTATYRATNYWVDVVFQPGT